jgi:hypothetical protein
VPRFFFNIRRDGRLLPDVDGALHHDRAAAIDEAVEGAREVVSAWVKAGDPVDAGGVVVTDEDGAIVGEVRFRDVVRTE